MTFPIALPLLAAALLAGGASAQTLFKCVDEKGVTHYGQTWPAACEKKVITEITKQGDVVRKVEPALTPEQAKAQREAALRRKEEEKRMAEQRLLDNALMATYGAEREFDSAREREAKQLSERQATLEKRLAEAIKRRERLMREAEFYTEGGSRSKSGDGKDRKDAKPAGKEGAAAPDAKDPPKEAAKDAAADGAKEGAKDAAKDAAKETAKEAKGASKARELPPQLASDLGKAGREVTNLQMEIKRLDTDRQTIAARYEADKQRWKRLNAGMPPGTILDEQGNVLLTPTPPSKSAK